MKRYGNYYVFSRKLTGKQMAQIKTMIGDRGSVRPTMIILPIKLTEQEIVDIGTNVATIIEGG